jgi:hypothetical protein
MVQVLCNYLNKCLELKEILNKHSKAYTKKIITTSIIKINYRVLSTVYTKLLAL